MLSHSSTLTLKNVTHRNEGVYSCVAVHIVGGLPSEHVIYLNVTGKLFQDLSKTSNIYYTAIVIILLFYAYYYWRIPIFIY